MKEKTKRDLKDVGIVGGAGYLGIKGKDRLLGLQKLYHGTSKENAKSIKRQGLLKSHSNKDSGATKWLRDFIRETSTDELNKDLASLKMVNKRLDTGNVNSYSSPARRIKYNPSKNNYYIEGRSNWKWDKTTESYKVEGNKNWKREFETLDDSKKYLKRSGRIGIGKSTQKLQNWTGNRVFATSFKPVGNFYSHMSNPKNSTNFLEGAVNIIQKGDRNLETATTKSQKKKADKDLLKGLKSHFMRNLKDSNNPLKKDGKTLPFKYPVAMKDKNFQADGIVGGVDELIERSFKEGGNTNPNSTKAKIMSKLWKEFQTAGAVDIDKKWFKPVLGPSAYLETAKNLPSYIKNHPIRFGVGAGLTAGAYSLGKDPAKRLYSKIENKYKDVINNYD